MQCTRITLGWVLLTLAATPAGASGLRQAGDAEVDRPRVVEVSPADGAFITEMKTEIRVRFDRPMNPFAVNLTWEGGGGYYCDAGPVRYDEAKHEFAIPVVLPPDGTHRVWVNMYADNWNAHRTGGRFMSVDGIPARPLRWVFKTRALDYDLQGPRPTVVSIDPPPGSRVPCITTVRVRLNQAMYPHEYFLWIPENDDRDRQRVGYLPFADYDPDSRTFTFTLVLPLDWSGHLEVRGLRSRRGIKAKPIRLEYSTGQTLFSDEQETLFAEARQHPMLRTVMENVGRARRQWTSVRETACLLLLNRDWEGRLTGLQSGGGVFKMQKPRHYYACATGLFDLPVCVGSDGERCWSYRVNREQIEYTVWPVETLDGDDFAIGDPFMARQAGYVGGFLHARDMRYVGETTLNGRPCHVLELWSIGDWHDGVKTFTIDRWWIDAEHWRPLRLEVDRSNKDRFAHSFQYDNVNEVIPDAEFRPPVLAGMSPSPPESSGDGCCRCAVEADDGASGGLISAAARCRQ